MINDTVGKTGSGGAERKLCCLCLRPIISIPDGLHIRYMGREMAIRDTWAHAACYDARYHGHVGLKGPEPQEKQAGLWEVSE